MVWQWVAFLGLILGAWLVGILLSRATRALFRGVVRRTSTPWDDAVLSRVGAPLTVAWTITCIYLASPSLEWPRSMAASLHDWLGAGLLVVFFWVLIRCVDVTRQMLTQSVWIRDRPARRSLLQLSARIGKVCLFAIGIVTLLSELGYPVASLVAGLGIGGLAVALAAQKTLENLFGALAIGADQCLREGDLVRIDAVLGTVEVIGLRSTRIRTLERTLVTIPNGKLAEMRLESFADRDRQRLACTLALVYGTSSEQVTTIVAGCQQALRDQPKLWPEGATVGLKELGKYSLNIEVNAWLQTVDADEYLKLRQTLLLAFMRVVEQAGSAFAYPTRTIQVLGKDPTRGDEGCSPQPALEPMPEGLATPFLRRGTGERLV
jgi:MscS family membrane protein